MLSSVLRSERAVAVNIEIMRAFVRLRQVLAAHTNLARRLEALERAFANKTKEHAAHIRQIYQLLDELMKPEEPQTRGKIGFMSEAKRED